MTKREVSPSDVYHLKNENMNLNQLAVELRLEVGMLKKSLIGTE